MSRLVLSNIIKLYTYIYKYYLTMEKSLNHISFSNEFFIRISAGVTNFRFSWMPEDVHFSIAHHPDSPYINFHVTRNTSDKDYKPKIVIFKISKAILTTILSTICQTMFDFVYLPLAFSYHLNLSKRKFAKQIKFLEFNEWGYLKDSLMRVFNQNTIRKNGRLKIEPSIVSELPEWTRNREIQRHLKKQFKRLPQDCPVQPLAGFLISPYYTGAVIILNGQYYQQKTNTNLKELAGTLMDMQLVNHLIFKTLLAIKRVSIAKDRESTEKFNQPVWLQ